MTMHASVHFLSVQDVLDLHRRTIDRHGGSHGVRDVGLLESAVALPQQRFDGVLLHQDVPAMAAAYLFHIACNHPFLDGNKRVALGACLIFLIANNVAVDMSPGSLTRVTLDVARGALDKAALTLWLREQLAPRGEP